MFKKGTRIYVVAFEPGDGVAEGGGFELHSFAEEAKTEIFAFLQEDRDFDHSYLIRRITLPRDFADRSAVTKWLDGDGHYLLETVLESPEETA